MKNLKTALIRSIAAAVGFSIALGAPAQTVTYFHNDLSGTPVVATDGAGNQVWRENYRPYGEKLNKQAASSDNRIGFHGKPFDDTTGLSYMTARYYDPVLGRFMGVDPKGFDSSNFQSFNSYAYANNNPYKYVDPDGREVALVILLLGTAAFVVAGALWYSARQEQGQQASALGRLLSRVLRSDSEEAAPPVPNTSAREKPGANSNVPPVPGGLVGDQSDPRAGPRKGRSSHTSGPLTPENGGVGDFGKDLESLTGGTRPAQPGDPAPPGSLIGANGIFGRPKNSSGGASIDIPANGSKPHETLHYP